MKKYLLVIALLIKSPFLFGAEVINLQSIAGKSQSEVQVVLGAATSCSESKHGKKCFFEAGETEIVFIKGKADWITVEGFDNIAFDEKALDALGLIPTTPDFKNEFTMRWISLEGYLEVSLFKGVSNLDYANIKVATK